MSALQFLNKKSWHTATIKNNEKRWLREQEAAKEKARIAELQKQLEEERKLEEIQKLEIESGRLDPAEVLKRKRLNWMYEYGPNETPAAAKRKEEKERDDMLLGKKEVDLDKLAEKEMEETGPAALLVDAESKMREDPLLEIYRERARVQQGTGQARAVLGKRVVSKKETGDELSNAKAAKRRRKEMRNAVREERKKRRAERAQMKNNRPEKAESETNETESSPQRRKDELDRRQKSRDKGDIPVKVAATTSTEYPHAGSGNMKGYGLHIPNGRTSVAVGKEFTPRNLGGRHANASGYGDNGTRRTHGRPPLPSPRAEGMEERRRRFESMRTDAELLEEERRHRIERHMKSEQRERENEDAGRRKRAESSGEDSRDPTRSFARNTIDRGVSIAGRVQQRRAWSSRNGEASY